jgi:hypothetical protein
VTPNDRDKVRLHALLKTKLGEAFNPSELSAVTGIDQRRIIAAGDALAGAGLIRKEESYYWAEKR